LRIHLSLKFCVRELIVSVSFFRFLKLKIFAMIFSFPFSWLLSLFCFHRFFWYNFKSFSWIMLFYLNVFFVSHRVWGYNWWLISILWILNKKMMTWIFEEIFVSSLKQSFFANWSMFKQCRIFHRILFKIRWESLSCFSFSIGSAFLIFRKFYHLLLIEMSRVQIFSK
jgi:hypothetical protein